MIHFFLLSSLRITLNLFLRGKAFPSWDLEGMSISMSMTYLHFEDIISNNPHENPNEVEVYLFPNHFFS